MDAAMDARHDARLETAKEQHLGLVRRPWKSTWSTSGRERPLPALFPLGGCRLAELLEEAAIRELKE